MSGLRYPNVEGAEFAITSRSIGEMTKRKLHNQLPFEHTRHSGRPSTVKKTVERVLLNQPLRSEEYVKSLQ